MTDPAALLAKMTLEQKIAQLQGLSIFELIDMTPPPPDAPPVARFALDRIGAVRPDGVGHVSLSWLLDADLDGFRDKLDTLQAHTREVSPFGIGALVHGEGINGFLHAQGQQFPTAWGQSSTWSPELIEKIGRTVGDQMHASGVHLAFAPVLDVARDLRWGRVHETYGEDPELAARNGVAYVRGIHADGGSVLATAKHFAGYGASEGGLNQARAGIGRREMRDVYAVPFARAIAEAGLSLVMNSYNEVDGIPAVADRWLLTDLLRDQLGFTGLVVSDYDAVSMLLKIYHTAATPGQAAAQALAAGVDVELPGNETFASLADEVRAGRLDERYVDDAALRVLEVKNRLGLVPGSTPRPTRAPLDADTDALSSEVAEASLVLLRNDDATLPLASLDGVAVVGTLADEVRIHFGAYTSASNEEQPLAIGMIMAGQVEGLDPATTIFTDLFQLRLPGIEQAFEARARQLHPEMPTVLDALRASSPDLGYVAMGTPDLEAEPIDEAALLAAVDGVDTVVAVVGERTAWVGNHTAGEGRTTTRNELPGNQAQLLQTLVAAGKTVVAVVISGRPLILTEALAGVQAVLLAPLQGPHAAPAIAGALTGRINPGGKLVSTFPRAIGQLPMYHGHPFGSGYDHPTGTRHGYIDLIDQSPLFAFGHGLSYTSFEVDDLSAALADDAITATVRVRNTGERSGDTVVQLYARDEEGLVVRPARQLLDFRRVTLAAGESAEVSFAVPVSRLAYTMPDGSRQVEAGAITVLAGFASDDLPATQTLSLPHPVAG